MNINNKNMISFTAGLGYLIGVKSSIMSYLIIMQKLKLIHAILYL